MKRSAELTKGFRTTILRILFSTSLIFFIISKILGSFAVYEGHDTENMLFLISSDLVRNFSYVFNAFVMSYIYVKLNPNLEEPNQELF